MGLEMNKRHVLRSLLCAMAALPATVCAAPLDALLTADQYHHAGEFRAEAGYDAMNDTLDVLGIRAKDPLYAGTNVGDYSGLHLRLGYALTDRLLLEGGAWRRKISYRSDNEALDSWQVAGQYRLWGDENSKTHFALRLSAWGDQASTLAKSTPTLVSGQTLNSVTINSPRDNQVQADAIGTWRLTRRASLSAFVGAGRSRVSTGDMSANYTDGNGCNYNLAFTATGTSVRLAAPCGDLLAAFVTTPQNMLQEFSYQASYYQLGGMWQWQNHNWSVRGGYQFQRLQRANVDALIASSGGVPYQSNHIVVAEAMRKVATHVAVFARGQVMSNQFVGEIPFAYNSATASKFARRYGYASLGVVMGF